MIWFEKSEQIEFIDFHTSKLEYMHDICNYLSEVIFLFYFIKICHNKIVYFYRNLSKKKLRFYSKIIFCYYF